jgi:uncharacterized protein YabE (DUF348 family)
MRILVMTAVLFLIIAALSTAAFLMRKTITVVIDGNPKKIHTYKNTVREALDANKISFGLKDRIEPELNTKISDKATIYIKRAVKVSIEVDGKELSMMSSEDTIEDLLRTENIALNTQDKIKPDRNTALSSNIKVDVIRVETKTFTDTLAVDFKTVVNNNSSLPNTSRKTVQDGKQGVKTIITDVVYENGQEVTRTTISEKVTTQPTDKIVVQGTYPLMPISRGGDPMPYSKVINARATAYYAVRGVGKTYTASGRLAVRKPDGYSTIAVDPSVIPFGTQLFIEGYGFAIAADSGTGIKGDTIDVYFDTYKEACNWAVKNVKVYILK